jgi:hypothetical protein
MALLFVALLLLGCVALGYLLSGLGCFVAEVLLGIDADEMDDILAGGAED